MDWFRRSLTGTSFITTRSISNFWKHLSCFLFFFFNSIGNTMRIVKHLFLDDWGLFFSRVLGWICHQKSSGQLLFTVVFLMALRSTLWKNDKERKKNFVCVCVYGWGEAKQPNGVEWMFLSIQQLSLPTSRPAVCHRLTVPPPLRLIIRI